MGFNANDAGFNTQPPEGGCVRHRVILLLGLVSTHSRPQAAAFANISDDDIEDMFQHTAARRRLPRWPRKDFEKFCVSTHSRPKAAAGAACLSLILSVVSTHSRPKAAALANRPSIVRSLIVSTHSRPKAAA